MLLRTIARPLLATAFVARGVDALQRPGTRIPAARRFSAAVAEPLGLPADPELLVRVNGAVTAGAGALLALSRMPRLAGAALALSLLPGAAFEHRFWEEDEPQTRDVERKQFLTNLGLLGAALLASADTAGRPGLAYRSRTALRTAGLRGELAASRATRGLSQRLPF